MRRPLLPLRLLVASTAVAAANDTADYGLLLLGLLGLVRRRRS